MPNAPFNRASSNHIKLLQDALALVKQNKHKQAADMLIKSGNKAPLVLHQAALCLMEVREFDEAEKILNRLVETNPTSEIKELHAALKFIRNDDKTEIETYKQILDINPDDEHALVCHAALYKDIKLDIPALLRLIKCAEGFISGAISPADYPESVVLNALLLSYIAFQQANLTELQFRTFDTVRKMAYSEFKNTRFYRSLMTSLLGVTVYEDYYTDEQYIELVHEFYAINKPLYENTITRNTDLYRELRIGFISSDLYFHPVGRFLLSLLTNMDKFSRISYYCYDTCQVPRNDVITEAIKNNTTAFRYIGDLLEEEAEKAVLNDKLDILFDLNGVSDGNCRDIVIRRLAQIQFTWIGFPCTAALKNVDYILVDPLTDPPQYAAKYYTEQLVYMQKTFLCYPLVYKNDTVLEIQPPPALKNGYITFGSFNNAKKYTKRTLRVWKEVLNRIPDARFYIICSTAVDEISSYGFKKQLEQSGIDLSRVELGEKQGFGNYLSMYNKVDIILDTFPFTGATTTCDAFLMGVPVITLNGVKHWERVCAAFLTHVGLGGLAAQTEQEYIEIAVRLSSDISYLKELRFSLRGMLEKSPLCDTYAFKTEFETVMRRLYAEYCMKNETKTKEPIDKEEVLSQYICALSYALNPYKTDAYPVDAATAADVSNYAELKFNELKAFVDENYPIEALELEAVFYMQKGDEKSVFDTYNTILKLEPDNEKALVYYTALYGEREFGLFSCKAIVNCVNLILEDKITAAAYLPSVIVDALTTGIRAAQRLNYMDLCVRASDKIRSLMPKEAKTSGFYRSLISHEFAATVYTDYHTDEQYTQLLSEMYAVNEPAHTNTFKSVKNKTDEIKVGFLSSDLGLHPVGRFLLAVLQGGSKIAYYCYDTNKTPRDDNVTQSIKEAVREFRFIGKMTALQAEKTVLSDNLDILFDLNGVSLNNSRELVNRRLAPVQFTWIGFPCSSGIKNMDYVLTDPLTDPPEYAKRFYTEQTAYMQKTFLCYAPVFEGAAAPVPAPAPVVKNGYITFGSFVNAKKYTPAMLGAWARIMSLLPDSKLIIASTDAKDSIAKYALKERFTKSGIDMRRVIFENKTEYAKYFLLYNKTDIILDVYPFNGATTTCDAFYMGVPVVSRYGVKHWERVGLAFLSHVGLGELAAGATDEYIKTAVNLANDVPRLISLRQTLREKLITSPLGNTAAFKAEFEELILDILPTPKGGGFWNTNDNNKNKEGS